MLGPGEPLCWRAETFQLGTIAESVGDEAGAAVGRGAGIGLGEGSFASARLTLAKLTSRVDLLSMFRKIPNPACDSPLDVYAAGGGDVTTRALPTTSTRESPGIQSTAMKAREGALPGLKYVP